VDQKHRVGAFKANGVLKIPIHSNKGQVQSKTSRITFDRHIATSLRLLRHERRSRQSCTSTEREHEHERWAGREAQEGRRCWSS
jgi:hypothetical protein